MAIIKQAKYKGKSDVSGLAGALIFETDNNRIIGRDNNKNPRLELLANGEDFFFKVSKPGVDVLTATNDELIFNSNQNIFKIVLSGTATIPAISQSGTPAVARSQVQVPHNFGYAPAFLAYSVETSTNQITQLPITNVQSYVHIGVAIPGLGWTHAADQIIYGISDTDNVTFINDLANINNDSTLTGAAKTIRYYILQETAN